MSIATIFQLLQNGGNILTAVKFFSFKERLCYLVFVKRHHDAGRADCHILQYNVSVRHLRCVLYDQYM